MNECIDSIEEFIALYTIDINSGYGHVESKHIEKKKPPLCIMKTYVDLHECLLD